MSILNIKEIYNSLTSNTIKTTTQKRKKNPDYIIVHYSFALSQAKTIHRNRMAATNKQTEKNQKKIRMKKLISIILKTSEEIKSEKQQPRLISD